MLVEPPLRTEEFLTLFFTNYDCLLQEILALRGEEKNFYQLNEGAFIMMNILNSISQIHEKLIAHGNIKLSQIVFDRISKTYLVGGLAE